MRRALHVMQLLGLMLAAFFALCSFWAMGARDPLMVAVSGGLAYLCFVAHLLCLLEADRRG